jgi:hypothetical protein
MLNAPRLLRVLIQGFAPAAHPDDDFMIHRLYNEDLINAALANQGRDFD